jgi:hypothetical protein
MIIHAEFMVIKQKPRIASRFHIWTTHLIVLSSSRKLFLMLAALKSSFREGFKV